MKVKEVISALSVLLLFSGCATSYHPIGLTGGYSDKQLAPDTFQVIFSGNGYTSDDRARDFALLRVADLVSQHGFICFAIVDERRTRHTDLSNHTIVLFYQPKEELTIKGFRVRPDEVFTYDALDIRRSLNEKYHTRAK
jgi:hypothetical protein